jgi:hypothetical protein
VGRQVIPVGQGLMACNNIALKEVSLLPMLAGTPATDFPCFFLSNLKQYTTMNTLFKKEYPKFVVYTDLVPPVTQENYFTQDFWIETPEGKPILTIRKGEMWWCWADNLLSGNVKQATLTLQDIIDAKEEEIKRIQKIL